MTPQTVQQADIEIAPDLRPAGAAGTEQYVINLCSSTTPMALQQPQSPELRHFKFFISRRLEDGRERFRLHMGHFDSLLQAEDMLQVVREIYPSAWVSEAPGRRLAARTGPEAVAPVHAPAPAPEPAPQLSLVAEPVVAPPSAAAPATPARGAVTAGPGPVPAPAFATRAAVPGDRRVKRVPPPPPASHSNVREVLKALDESPREPAAVIPTLQAEAGTAMTDSQVLRVLEGAPSATGIHMVKPEETGTFAAIREAVQARAPVAFAIQLLWSVQPVDVARVPPLAIFNAYRLYTVEGNRDGRRWYGLRLGFFGDANAAKQVAQYVRSEFASVAVVPVTEKERDGASSATPVARAPAPPVPAPPATVAASPKLERLPEQSAEFKLFDDTAERRMPPAPQAAARAAGGRAGRNGQQGRRVQAGEKRTPQTLEETLEILGADALSVEEGRGPALASGGRVKHMSVRTERRDSRLGRLFGRLGERD